MQPRIYWQGLYNITLSCDESASKLHHSRLPQSLAGTVSLYSLPRRPSPFCINPLRDALDFSRTAEISRNDPRNLIRECKNDGSRSGRHLGVPKHMRHKAMIISCGESQNGLTRVLRQESCIFRFPGGSRVVVIPDS